MADKEITVLLLLEAMDKASSIFDSIGSKLSELGQAAQDAADKASMSGDELEAAQIKAEAAANAAADAAERAKVAQADLATATAAVADAQAKAAEAGEQAAAAEQAVAAEFGDAAKSMMTQYAALSDAAAANADAIETSGAKIADLEAKLEYVHGAAADQVQAALDKEKLAYAELAEAAQASADAVAEAFDGEQAKVLESWAAQADAAKTAADAVKAATAEQIESLDALSTAQATAAKRATESAEAQSAADTSFDVSGAALSGLKMAAVGTAAAVAGIGYESVKTASSFQSATTTLATSGGEVAGQIANWQNGTLKWNGTLDQVRQGILNLAGSTGTSTQQLTSGMYMIGSAGYTGAAGINVLKSAAQGAKAENADLGVVSNALTTIMKDYGVSVSSAAQSTQASNAAMDQMIAVVQNGKTTTEALAGSLSNVLPVASAAKLGFDQVGGALATMTGEGTSAQQASQDLANTIRNLQSPTQVASNEMLAMGLNSNTVSQQLGSKGLTGTLAELTQAITAHMGPSGQVIMSTFQNATTAAADAKQMIASMPASLQSLATAFLNGSVSSKQWRTDLQGLDPVSAHLMTQFATTAEKADSFNSLLTSGQPAAQTYTAALSKMLGGATGLNTALQLTGANMATFQANVKAVGDAGKNAGTDVNGWAEIQGNMNQKLDELKQTVSAAAIQLGTALLPMVTKILDAVMKVITPIATWIEHNKSLAAIILLLVGGLGTLVTMMIAVAKVVSTVQSSWKVLTTLFTQTAEKAAAAGAAAEAAGDEAPAGGEAADVAWGPWLLLIAAIAAAAYLIVTHWSTVKKWLEDFWNWFKGIFNDAKDFVAKWWPELLAPITGGMSLLVKFLMDHWTAISDFFKKAWSDLVGLWNATGGKALTAISKAWGDVTAEISRLWQNEVKGLGVIWGEIVSAWNASGGKAVSAIAHAWDEASSAVTKEWKKISGDLSSIWGSLVEIWNGTGGKLVSLIADNWKAIEDAFDTGLHAIEDVVKPVLDGIVDFFKVQFEILETIAKAAWDLISGIVRVGIQELELVVRIGLTVLEGIFRITWGIISGLVRAAWDAIKGIVEGSLDVIGGLIKAGWDIVVGIVKATWDLVITIINIALDTIKGVFKAFADLVTGQWGKLWDDVKSMFSTVWTDISGFFTKILGDIGTTVTGAVSSIFGGFEHGIEDALSGIGKALDDVWHTVVNAFEDAGTWLLDAGKQIIQGLINGVEGMAKTAVNSVKNVGQDIINGAKSVLSIFSPSKEFHTIGTYTIAGFVEGIEAAAPTLTAAMAKAAGSITGPSLTGQLAASARGAGSSLVAATASGLAQAGGAGSGSGGTVINLTVSGNTVMSDSDIDKLVTKIGNRLPATLNAGGVRITTLGRR